MFFMELTLKLSNFFMICVPIYLFLLGNYIFLISIKFKVNSFQYSQDFWKINQNFSFIKAIAIIIASSTLSLHSFLSNKPILYKAI